MLDGADLADALLQAEWQKAVAVAVFEQTMCARAEGPARSAGVAIQEVFLRVELKHSLHWARILSEHLRDGQQ
jgi:hypothetical protein